MRVLVFGYGSLAPGGGTPARLHGYRRAWNVAMDNRATIPGYKYYVDAAGRRPEVFVTFLNLVPGDGVDGVVFEADRAALDARERNYRRVDVSDRVELPGPVYAYIGLDEAVARFEAGHREGRAVAQRAYVESVRGIAEPPPELPVLDLTRIDLPVGP
jgi:cation transport regulator ChaC